MAPLNTCVMSKFTIKTQNRKHSANLQLELCQLSPTEELTFQFVDNITDASIGDISVEVTYKSSVPVSGIRTIHIIDEDNKKYPFVLVKN